MSTDSNSKKSFFIYFQYLAPQILLTKFAGFLSTIQLPWIKNALIRYFLSRHEVVLNEAIESDPFKYKNFHDFFTRQLKPNARIFDNNENIVCSPVDGILSQFGPLCAGKLIQAKGFNYSLVPLLGKSDAFSKKFEKGHFATIYLSPKHYHRVHMPIDGTLLQLRYIPGRLFSVNQETAKNIPDLFCKNERVVMLFETKQGKIAVIMVGAMLVGNIVTQFTGSLSIHRTDNEPRFIDYPNTSQHHIFVKKGEELGYFTMGSTVILLTEHHDINLGELSLNQELLLGQKLFGD